MVGDALNASEWDTAFETGVCGSAAWRLGALSLALLRETTLETAFPASGEVGPLHLPPELLVRLLVLFHSLHLRDVLPPEADDTVSGSLHLELQAFICARLLPFFRSAAERAASQNGPPPPIWEVLVRVCFRWRCGRMRPSSLGLPALDVHPDEVCVGCTHHLGALCGCFAILAPLRCLRR